MKVFYDKLFYIITGLAILAILYTKFGDLFTSLAENFGLDIYVIYFVTIFIIIGIARFFGSSFKSLNIFDKSKRKSKRQIKKEERTEEKSRRLELRNNFEYSKSTWTGNRVFHALISVTITSVVYLFYGEIITELSEFTDRSATFLYIALVVGIFVIIRISVKPLVWLFAGNKDKW